MSRIGRKLIDISGANVSLSGNAISVSGPLGALSIQLSSLVSVEISDNILTVSRTAETKSARQHHGLFRALIANMVHGVSKGFTRTLELVGVGYRVSKEGDGIGLLLGFSHPVVYTPPVGVKLDIDGQTKIKVSGIDAQLVGSVVNDLLTKYRPLEPYKGKGIKIEGTVGRRKAGKSAK